MARRVAGSFVRQPRGQPLRASLLQQAFVDFEPVLAGAPVFHLAIAARVRGRLDVRALERAIGALIARHETLRTTFAPAAATGELGGADAIGADAIAALGPTLDQVIAPALPVRLVATEVADLHAAEALASERLRQPFDLQGRPPVRPQLYRVDRDAHLVVLALHHVAVDMWALGQLWGELWTDYAALAAGGEPAPTAGALDYADFAAWHNAELPRLSDALKFWRGVIGDGIPVLALPVDRPRSATTGYAGARRAFAIPDAVARGLAALARDHGATPWMIYLAAFAAMLGRVTGQRELGIGTPVSTLGLAQRQGVVGPFLNLLPVRADLTGGPSFVALIAQACQAARDTWSRRLVPWAWLEPLGPACPPGITPHFQVMFNFATRDTFAHAGALAAGDVAIEPADVEAGAVEFDLSLMVITDGDTAAASFEYKTGLFEPATIDRLAGELIGVLAAAVADPARPIV